MSADLTLKQRQAGIGMSHHRLFLLCGHSGSITGAQYRKGLGWMRCAKCHAARLAAKSATV